MPEDQENCRTAKELLRIVTAEIARYQSKNLSDLQTKLQAFVSAQDGWVTDYKSKFPNLRQRWRDNQEQVERLCVSVKCEFPVDKWREVIELCICTPTHDLCCLNQRIAKRNYCCAGPHERAVNEAAATLDRATAHLTWMKALTTGLDAEIAANAALVTQIPAVPPTERATVLYLFYKLRRSQVHLAPFDAPKECKEICMEFDCDQMCRDVLKRPCPDEDCACTPKTEWPHHSCHHCEKIDGPWLMSPEHYRHALDCAFDSFHKATDKLAEAQSELTKYPDDLKSLIAQRDALIDPKNANNLENNITNCLKAVKVPSEESCREYEPRKGGY